MANYDHTYTDNIVCPYCGYEDKDSWEFSSDDGKIDCGSCGETFEYERIITIQYSTHIPEDKCDHRDADIHDNKEMGKHFFDCDDCGKLEVTDL